MKRRVYIVNNGGHNYDDAARFGEIVFCTDSVMRKDDTAQMYRELNNVLRESEPHDYILISSLATLCSIATGIMAAQHGEVHLLLYKDGQYVERDIIFDN